MKTKKLLLLLFTLFTSVSGAWAAIPDDYFSTDYEHAVWLSITNASNTDYVMFATNSTMGTRQKGSTNYAAWQQVAFVGTKSNFKIYSYSQGSTKALYAANSNNGTAVSWVDPASASTWTLEESFVEHATPGYGICLSGQTGMSLNMYAGAGGDCKFYTHAADYTGSRWTIAITSGLVVEEGKVYKISSYRLGGTTYQIINSETASKVINTGDVIETNQGYWLCHTNGGAYTFESAMGDGKYLAWKGLSTTAKEFDLHFATKANVARCVSLYSHNNDTGGGRYLYVHKNASGGTNGWNQNGSPAFADAGSTDYVLEEVNGVDVYTVVSNINAGGVTYTPSYTGTATQTKDGFYVFSSAPSASDFTAKTVTDFTPGEITVNTTTKTITVNYSSTYSYTFTDINGQEYTGTISGEFGVTPTLTGSVECSLTGGTWDETNNSYTATINFPLPVSSNSVMNWTYINSFENKNGYKVSDGHYFYWHADGTKVIVHDKDEPTNETGQIEKYKWAIIPSCDNGNVTFTLKNASTNKFIYTTQTGNSHSGAVTLEAIGTPVTLIKSSTNNCGDIYVWYIPSTGKHLSVNSVTNLSNGELGVWSLAATHDGPSFGLYAPANFTTLMANLQTARNKFIQYLTYFNSGTYTETVSGAMLSAYEQQATDRNVVKDSPTAYFTATQFKTYTDNYNAAVNGLNYVMPSFFRVKNVDESKYVKTSTISYVGEVQLDFSEGGTDAASVFYLNASNNIIAYNSGSYLIAVNNTSRIDNFPWRGQFSFLKGSAAPRIIVYSNAEPTSWAGDNKYWQYNNDKIDRVESANASEFLIEKVTSLPITMHEVGGAYYGTIKLPVAVTLPEGLFAYSATASDDVLTLTKVVENGVLAANQPVLLYSASNVTSLDISDETGTSAASNEFDGTIAAASVTANENYVLGANAGNVGFYKFSGNVMPGFKAYLPASATTNVKFFSFSFEDAETAIRAIESENNGLEIYDMNGRRVQKAQKGLYIVNGKKVMYK